ncbi:hypothetical protein CPLU01_07973 [Colletotrichum plurivorum]|uniref:Uncharacterized protein n=1 Tax=Colletotrichum plurivorum TaxID=2175906 RepID=A0A8H6KEN0_9PEZI|nr:hypothetical protein CPLU01_07973 [Colletotrichum plurivorum]
MNSSSTPQNPPYTPDGPGSIHPSNVPSPPPGAVAVSLAACVVFVIVGFGAYFLIVRCCRADASKPSARRCETPMPLSPMSPCSRHARDLGRGRGSPRVFDGGFPGAGNRTKCSAAMGGV